MKFILVLNKVDFQKGPTFQCITKRFDEKDFKMPSKCYLYEITILGMFSNLEGRAIIRSRKIWIYEYEQRRLY